MYYIQLDYIQADLTRFHVIQQRVCTPMLEPVGWLLVVSK